MQVASSSLSLASAHLAAESREVQERLEIRAAAAAAGDFPVPQDTVDIVDPKLLLIELLFGTPPGRRLQHGRAAQQAAAARPAVSYSRREVHREVESSSFAAEGTVTLESGETIEFSLRLQMNRELTEVTDVSFRAGQMSDPIVVNLDGAGVRLTGERQAFDLNGDGVDEAIARLAAGSAWLARDVNGNGKVDNGGELFGPASGNGFGELAALDTDGNGWIDQGDSAYSAMGIWNGGAFTSLDDAGIGALATVSVSTPFALKQGAELLGQVRDSSVYLREDGTPGALQQIDLVL